MNTRDLELRVLPQAALQIDEQAIFYEGKSGTKLAERWTTAVNESIRSLLSFPERGSFWMTPSPDLADLRRLHIDGFPKHLIFYRYNPIAMTLLIVGVLHGSRDLDALLDPPSLE